MQSARLAIRTPLASGRDAELEGKRANFLKALGAGQLAHAVRVEWNAGCTPPPAAPIFAASSFLLKSASAGTRSRRDRPNIAARTGPSARSMRARAPPNRAARTGMANGLPRPRESATKSAAMIAAVSRRTRDAAAVPSSDVPKCAQRTIRRAAPHPNAQRLACSACCRTLQLADGIDASSFSRCKLDQGA